MNSILQQLIFVFLLSLINCNESSSNLIKREIEQDKEKELSKDQGIYFIKDDITSLYPTNAISLFISIIDCSLHTKLTFPSTISNYSSNYNSLLGETKYYYQLHQNLKTKPQYYNSITNETSTLNLEDDIFIHKATIDFHNTTIDLFILRNQFANQLNLTKSSNDKLTNLRFLDFYDLNIVFNRNSQTIDFSNKNNVLFPSLNTDDDDDNDNNSIIINETDAIELLSKNSYEMILNNELIREKIKRMNSIRKALDSLLNNQMMTINLFNFLLSAQIADIKLLVEDVQKSLLPLISFPLKYTEEVFNYKLNQLSERANKVISYIEQFDFSSSDAGIYLAYYFCLFVLICIGGYYIALTVKEFRIEYQKKIK